MKNNENEIKNEDENEIKKPNIFSKLESIRNYIISKNKKDSNNNNEIKNFQEEESEEEEEEINEDDLIYIKYLNNPDIIFQDKGDINNKNLKLIFEELDKDIIDKENNMIIPYLDIIPNLVKAYIQSDLDDKENDELSVYQKIFIKLKNNSFVDKETIYNLYEFFSKLYHSKDLTYDLVKKLNKMYKLFEIFYTIDNDAAANSSVCILGGSLTLFFDKKLSLIGPIKIFFKIEFINYCFDYITKDCNIISTNDIKLDYHDVIKNISDEKLIYIKFIVSGNGIELRIKTDVKEVKINKNFEIKEVKEIQLLEGLFGQISSIKVSLNEEEKITYSFYPISIRNNKYIYHNKKSLNFRLSKMIPKISISDPNLVKINYINMKGRRCNVIDYFGGIKPFLPFYQIFKNMKKEVKLGEDEPENVIDNDNIFLLGTKKTSVVTINKYNKFINSFSSLLIKIVVDYLFSMYAPLESFKKNFLFIYYLILDLDFELTCNLLEEHDKETDNLIYPYIELFVMIFYNTKNPTFFDIKNEIKEFIKMSDNKNKIDFNIFHLPKKPFNQIYRQYMKQLFIFNGLWSKKSIFFKKDISETEEIKYKQINYFTKNFQLPYFYPILEINRYYPQFSKLKEGIFFGKDINMLKYDFSLNINKRVLDIIKGFALNSYIKYKNSVFELCCHVKNSYHTYGYLTLYKKNNKNADFVLEFQDKNSSENKAGSNPDDDNCNLSVAELKAEHKFCYGSIFKTPNKEYNRKIIIKSKDITFILIREYFHRVSAIEIFTLNKSYFFSFKKMFEINNIKTNKILNEIKNNQSFKPWKLTNEKREKITLGFYNPIYETYYYPLFKDEINNWDKKVRYYNNYDTLITINLLSNRSYRDIFQYPIFPTLYSPLKLKRDIGSHIGFQDINVESKNRKNLFIQLYNINEDDEENSIHLFNIHYNNPAFVFNFLLRVLPYSFMSVEFQGDDFDSPNRLFYSVRAALISTLSIKSDLREFIPELFYMVELFYNKNNLFFDKLYNGKNINYVVLSEEGNDEQFQTDIERMSNIAKFLVKMRDELDKIEDINKWINLFFGVKQKYFIKDNEKYNYYDKRSEILFKNIKNYYENYYIMNMVDFGMQPYQIFNKDFPIKPNDYINVNGIKSLNFCLVEEEHLKDIFCPTSTFICKGRILINNSYLQNIQPHEEINQLNFLLPKNNLVYPKISTFNNTIFESMIENLDLKHFNLDQGLVNYYFIGDVFGSVYVYKLVEIKSDKNSTKDKHKIENKDKKDSIEKNKNNPNYELKVLNDVTFGNIIQLILDNKNKLEFSLQLKKKLNDHSKEIKFINFNPRLNALLTYSLDKYINIYIFPKLKLINVIDTTIFKNKNDINPFEKVVFLSYPLPMIVCYNLDYIYLLSINGNLLKEEKLKKEHKIKIYVDKNLGLVGDIVEISEGNEKHIFNMM